MIKYLGSKRRLVSALGDIYSMTDSMTSLDLFTGTTRVAQEFKRRGSQVTAVDTARYADIFSKCYIETDASHVDYAQLRQVIAYLNSLPGEPGYFTETFCIQSRYFMPKNGARVDRIRNVLATEFKDDPLYPVLLTSLIEAADRVDSTTGVQMAYLKSWAARSSNPLELRVPDLLPGTGTSVLDNAVSAVDYLGPFDIAYLDPPYNQHRYFTNYHVWETLVAWDAPEHYGIACKRLDSRDATTKSVFNQKRDMPAALQYCIENVKADTIIVSYNNEAWIELDALIECCLTRGPVEALAFDSKRYVGAQIGIYNPSGEKVGKVSHLRNLEYVLVVGNPDVLKRVGARFGGVDDPNGQPSLF